MEQKMEEAVGRFTVWGNKLQWLEAPRETPMNLVVKDVHKCNVSLVDQGFVGKENTPITMSTGSQEQVETMINLALEDPLDIPDRQNFFADANGLRFHINLRKYNSMIKFIDNILRETEDDPRAEYEFPKYFGLSGAKVMGYAGAGINQFRRYTADTINAKVYRTIFEKKMVKGEYKEIPVDKKEMPINAVFDREELKEFREYLIKFRNMTDNEILREMQGYHPDYLFKTLPQLIKEKRNWSACGMINNGGYIGQVYMMWSYMYRLFIRLMPSKWYFWITSNLAEGDKVTVSKGGSKMPSGHCKSIYMDVFGNFVYGRIDSHSARGPLAAPSLLYRNMFSKIFPLFNDIELKEQKPMLEFKGFMNQVGTFKDKAFSSYLKAMAKQVEDMANSVINAANTGRLPVTSETAEMLTTNPGRLANISGYVPEPMCETPPRLFVTPMEAIGEPPRKRTAPRSDEPEAKRNLEKKGRTIIIKTNRFPGKKEDQSTVKK